MSQLYLSTTMVTINNPFDLPPGWTPITENNPTTQFTIYNPVNWSKYQPRTVNACLCCFLLEKLQQHSLLLYGNITEAQQYMSTLYIAIYWQLRRSAFFPLCWPVLPVLPMLFLVLPI